MNHEQVERTIEFILEHQAQTSIHLEQMAIHLEQMAGHGGDVQTAILTLTDLAQAQSHRMDRQEDRLTQHDESL